MTYEKIHNIGKLKVGALILFVNKLNHNEVTIGEVAETHSTGYTLIQDKNSRRLLSASYYIYDTDFYKIPSDSLLGLLYG